MRHGFRCRARPAALVLLPALLAVTLRCGGEPPRREQAPRPVRTVVVERGSETAPAVLAGVAKAGLESNLSFRVGGTLVELPAAVGRSVRRGDLLGRLDPTDYELAVEEAKASLAQSQATLRRAIADYGRVRALYENNNAAKSELDAARAQFESAEAQVQASEYRLALARQQVDYTVLRAPLDGAIAAVPVEINETIAAGQTVARITSGTIPEIEVAVAEVTIPYIIEGMPATVTFGAIPDKSFNGHVIEVGVATSDGGSTYPVTVQLERSDSMIRSGMAADVRFALRETGADERLVVPVVAVGEDRHGRFVFVVEDQSDGVAVVRRRGVGVGRLVGRGIEILSGIEPGEVIVTAGVRRMVDGMRVRYRAEDS